VAPPSDQVIAALEAIGIGKSYQGVRALSDVSLELLPGEIHGLVGANGAGKPTGLVGYGLRVSDRVPL
jgi:ribose transport system ATP-binding protein